jgi:hypothetical protein
MNTLLGLMLFAGCASDQPPPTSADPTPNALGITQYRVDDNGTTIRITGLDAQSQMVAELTLTHGTFEWRGSYASEHPGEKYGVGRDLTGQRAGRRGDGAAR